jgi:hypothetical protein
MIFEKQLIRLLNTLADVLYCLRADLLPERITLAKFSDMSLKFGAVQVLAPYAVVPFMEGNTVVVDTASNVNCPLEVSALLVTI